MEIERKRLLRKGYGVSKVDTTLPSRKDSTPKMYNHTWQKFVSWCTDELKDVSSPSVHLILEFLQSGLDKGLSTSIFQRQVAALSAILGPRKGGGL